MNATLYGFAPLLTLVLFAFLLLGLDAANLATTSRTRRLGFGLSLAGLLITFVMSFVGLLHGSFVFGRGMLVTDGLSLFISSIGLISGLFCVLMSAGSQSLAPFRLAAYYALLLLSVAGVMILGMAQDWVLLFIGIELVGIPTFILSGYLRRDARSSEAALKFFLIGAFSSAMLAYGISIIYGLVGSTALPALRESTTLAAHGKLALIGFLLILVSLGFKIALAPFHMWVPDTFHGAPPPVAAFLSVAPKIAGAGVLLRVYWQGFHGAGVEVLTLLAILAALTMTVANVIGLWQTQVIRLLAYSSIAHMGFLVLGIIAGGLEGTTAFYLYGGAYVFMNAGAFAALAFFSDALGSRELADFAGVAKRAPVLSGFLAILIFSLAGFPPTLGFLAKLYAMSAVLNTGWMWLVIVAGINAVIATGYYLKILRAIYFLPGPSLEPLHAPWSTRVAVTVACAVTLLGGLVPQVALSSLRRLADFPMQQSKGCCETPAAPEVVHEP